MRILHINPLAVSVPCDNSFLNLVEIYTVRVNVDVVTFLGDSITCVSFQSHQQTKFSEFDMKYYWNNNSNKTEWSDFCNSRGLINTSTPTETTNTIEYVALIDNAVRNVNLVTLLLFQLEGKRQFYSSIDTSRVADGRIFVRWIFQWD